MSELADPSPDSHPEQNASSETQRSLVIPGLAIGVAATGLLISLLLALGAAGQVGSVLGCGTGGGCEGLSKGHYGSVLGMSVAWLGVLSWGGILVARLMGAWRLLLVLTWAAAGAGLWFIVVQSEFIGAWCVWCLAAHVCAGVHWLLIMAEWRQAPAAWRFNSCLAGLAAAGALAGTQLMTRPKDEPLLAPNFVMDPPLQSLHVDDLPAFGSEGMPLVALAADPGCVLCRRVHGWLREEVDAGRLRLVVIPVAISAQCNRYVRAGADQAWGEESCRLAAILLAVARIDSGAADALDRMLYDGEHMPSYQQVRSEAEQLVSLERLDAELEDPALAARLLELSGASLSRIVQMETGELNPNAALVTVPRLLFPDASTPGAWTTSGVPGTREELLQFLEARLHGEPSP